MSELAQFLNKIVNGAHRNSWTILADREDWREGHEERKLIKVEIFLHNDFSYVYKEIKSNYKIS